MIELLNYPFNSDTILRKRKALRKELLNSKLSREIRIAILGGSTTNELVNVIELFLLKVGLSPVFYESEYNKFYEDALFGSTKLSSFKPEIILIHTTHLNILEYPSLNSSTEGVDALLNKELDRFRDIWNSLKKYNCPIIQNNFDFPIDRVLGNLDCYDLHGKTYFLTRLNLLFAEDAQKNSSLYINDINYLSAKTGIDNWFDYTLWFSAKYAISFKVIPVLANNIVNIIKAILGMTKKCLVLDLDNTCWGGVIGDDGINGIKLGNESAKGEAYMNFQHYVKDLKKKGVILAVSSKNSHLIAEEAFQHSDSILKYDDFSSFKANWAPKYENIKLIADEINIGLDSIVFIDDNAMERNIIESQLPSVAVPNVTDNVLNFIGCIESNGYFETVNLSKDDLNRNKFYLDNRKRVNEQEKFVNYEEFLKSLQMKAQILEFENTYYERITQLINKTNQFNLTTKRYTVTEVEYMAMDEKFISLFGKLADIFGDNGLISVLIAEIKNNECFIDTWLMSCRVLKRDMEYAMFDVLVTKCRERNIRIIVGEYIPTMKNKMVEKLYEELGFALIKKEKGQVWKLLLDNYNKRRIPIDINK